jgi:hypothetical protein
MGRRKQRRGCVLAQKVFEKLSSSMLLNGLRKRPVSPRCLALLCNFLCYPVGCGEGKWRDMQFPGQQERSGARTQVPPGRLAAGLPPSMLCRVSFLLHF